jgi:hypothetical protein
MLACTSFDMPTPTHWYLSDNRTLERMSKEYACKTVVDSLQYKLYWISSLHSMKQSIRSLFNCFRNPRHEEAILGSQINEVLVPAMYRFMIGNICSRSSVYQAVCKDLSSYETLILSEVVFKYETSFNIIWHTHNLNLLFHELPSLIPPVLHSILTHPCSDTVTNIYSNANDYLECAKFYADAFSDYTQKKSSLGYVAEDIRYYGLLMDFIYANISPITQHRGEIWSIQPSERINADLRRASKALVFCDIGIQSTTKKEFLKDINNAIPEIIFKRMVGEELSEMGFRRIDDARIMMLLTEDERSNFDQASRISIRRSTMTDKFREIVDQVRERLLGICIQYGSLFEEFSKYTEPYKTDRPYEICEQSLTNLINHETQIKSGDRVFENQESLDVFLVPSMYRRMIGQICKNSAFQKICRPLSAYETMISKETKFGYDKGFTIIWNLHNPDILFHEIPSLLPSWLSPIVNYHCSGQGHNCAKYYSELFGTEYGYIMDSVLHKKHSKQQPSRNYPLKLYHY